MVSFIRQYRFFLISLLAFFVEISMLTVWRNKLGPHVSAVVFFLSSLTIGLVGLRLSFLKTVSESQPVLKNEKNNSISPVWRRYVPFFLVAILCLAAYTMISPIIDANPIQVEQSDIIPQTQVLAQRFVHHQFPYHAIPFPGYDLFPTYQPLQWLPYTLAEISGIDYRKFAFVLLLLCLLGFTIFIRGKKLSAIQQLLVAALPFFPFLFIAAYAPSIYDRTLENMIAAYYFVLCMAIFSRSVVVLAAAMVCCLLSRYSIIFWVPLFLFMLYCSGDRKKAYMLGLLCAGGVLLIYVLPFFSHDTSIFLKGYLYHSKAALVEWQGQGWQKPGEKPVQLFRGLGLAGIFYDNYKGSVQEKLKAFQLLHLVLCTVTCILLGIFYYRKRKHVSLPIFALASLVIYLSFFYHFIQIPYDYLFLTLIYVSIPVLWLSLKSKVKSKK